MRWIRPAGLLVAVLVVSSLFLPLPSRAELVALGEAFEVASSSISPTSAFAPARAGPPAARPRPHRAHRPRRTIRWSSLTVAHATGGPEGVDPEAPPLRTERHVVTSIATLRRQLTVGLAHKLDRCPCCCRTAQRGKRMTQQD